MTTGTHVGTDATRRNPRIGHRVAWVTVALFAVALTIAFLRLRALDYDLGFVIPETVWNVDIVQTVDAHGETVRLQTFLPAGDARQRVFDERNQSDDFSFSTRDDGGNRVGAWVADAATGSRVVTWSFRFVGTAVRYDLSREFRLGDTPPGAAGETLEPTPDIQSTAPEITALAQGLVPQDRGLVGFLHAAFDRVGSLGYKPFKGSTDALTALRLGEASCNGRSRLFVALLRAQGVPARLVGGLVLERGTKRTSHQWVEVWIGGHWVPFDPTNGHFAEIPHNYLTLYRGDHVLFRHTSDVGFDYGFTARSSMEPRQSLEQRSHVLGFWAVFSHLGIPLELLKVIIMIPVGALVAVIFRNVLGLRVFGTFLPVLIAAAARSTGFWWGALGFAMLVVLVSGIRRLLDRLQLLHSAQLAVLLTTVIGTSLLLALGAERAGLTDLAHMTLFPVAIMAITAERFSVIDEEEGTRVAFATMARSLIVIGFCYLTMNSLSLQILMLGFPELLLVVIAVDIWLGRWIGLRFTEWIRFKVLLWRRGAGEAA